MASATAGDAPEGGAGATLEDALRSAAAPRAAGGGGGGRPRLRRRPAAPRCDRRLVLARSVDQRSDAPDHASRATAESKRRGLQGGVTFCTVAFAHVAVSDDDVLPDPRRMKRLL